MKIFPAILRDISIEYAGVKNILLRSMLPAARRLHLSAAPDQGRLWYVFFGGNENDANLAKTAVERHLADCGNDRAMAVFNHFEGKLCDRLVELNLKFLLDLALLEERYTGSKIFAIDGHCENLTALGDILEGIRRTLIDYEGRLRAKRIKVVLSQSMNGNYGNEIRFKGFLDVPKSVESVGLIIARQL